MKIAPTKDQIEWLLERLYIQSRYLQAVNVLNPVFVVLTNNGEDRDKVEVMILDYIRKRYGDLSLLKDESRNNQSTFLIFNTPLNFSIGLMDISEELEPHLDRG